MKQHIHYTQVIKELNKKQIKKLTDWAIKKDYLTDLYRGNYSPSIGQMIEFLNEKQHIDIVHQFYDQSSGHHDVWHIKAFGDLYYNEEIHLELIDALWEAIKEVL